MVYSLRGETCNSKYTLRTEIIFDHKCLHHGDTLSLDVVDQTSTMTSTLKLQGSHPSSNKLQRDQSHLFQERRGRERSASLTTSTVRSSWAAAPSPLQHRGPSRNGHPSSRRRRRRIWPSYGCLLRTRQRRAAQPKPRSSWAAAGSERCCGQRSLRLPARSCGGCRPSSRQRRPR